MRPPPAPKQAQTLKKQAEAVSKPVASSPAASPVPAASDTVTPPESELGHLAVSEEPADPVVSSTSAIAATAAATGAAGAEDEYDDEDAGLC